MTRSEELRAYAEKEFAEHGKSIEIVERVAEHLCDNSVELWINWGSNATTYFFYDDTALTIQWDSCEVYDSAV